MSVNVEGTATLLAALRAQRSAPWILFASSREVYGNPEVQPVGETAPMRPANIYGRSKAQGEGLVMAARRDGLRTGILRLSNVYGTENDHPDRAVPALLWRAHAGEPLHITGAATFFDFTHVADCVDGLCRAIDALEGGRDDLPPLHLVSGRRTSLLELAHAAIGVTGSASPVRVAPARAFDVAGFHGDPERAAATLGWRARIKLEDGLSRLHAIFSVRGAPLDPVPVPDAAHRTCLKGPRPEGRQGGPGVASRVIRDAREGTRDGRDRSGRAR